MYRTLLLPLDGSPFADRALRVAARLSARTGARVEVVTVLDPTMFIQAFPAEPRSASRADMREQHAAEQRMIDSRIAALRARGIDAAGAVLEGIVVETILDRVQTSGADLIVMTTHGRGGFDRLRNGSIANALVAGASVPVLLVPASMPEDAVVLEGDVLCPLDGGAFAESILTPARALADSVGAQLSLLHVQTEEDDPSLDAAGYLDALRTELGTTTATIVESEEPAAAIVAQATAERSGAIAMATHARGGLSRLLFGSVTDAVIRTSPVPVLSYRPPE